MANTRHLTYCVLSRSALRPWAIAAGEKREVEPGEGEQDSGVDWGVDWAYNFESVSSKGEEGSFVTMWVEGLSGRGNNQCKAPEVGMCLVWSRKSKEGCEAGVKGAGERNVEKLEVDQVDFVGPASLRDMGAMEGLRTGEGYYLTLVLTGSLWLRWWAGQEPQGRVGFWLYFEGRTERMYW